MKLSILCIASACLLSADWAAAQGVAPRLAHSAPWLGHDLALSISQAPPFAAVRMLESDAAGVLATHYGRLELDPASMRVAGVGTTDADGRFELVLPIALDPALAETEVHYQALVADPAAPGGTVLSEARHLRRMGPRVYANCQGREQSPYYDPAPGGIAIVSASKREVVALVDCGVPDSFASPSRDALPVFSEDYSRGAVTRTGGEVIIFDPFFGELLATVPLANATRKLALAADGRTAIALEPNVDPHGYPLGPARLHAIDILLGEVVAIVELPRASSGVWEWNAERDEIYIAELVTYPGKQYVRRIGLQGLQDLGAIPVGGEGFHPIRSIESAGTSVLVATYNSRDCMVTGDSDGVLTHIDYAFDPPLVESAQRNALIRPLVPLPALERVYSAENPYACYAGYFELCVRRLDQLDVWQPYYPQTSFADEFPRDWAWDGDRLWMVFGVNSDAERGLLWFDAASESFAAFRFTIGSVAQVEVVHDALVHVGAVDSGRYTTFPAYETNLVLIEPEGTRDWAWIPILYGCETLLGVGLP